MYMHHKKQLWFLSDACMHHNPFTLLIAQAGDQKIMPRQDELMLHIGDIFHSLSEIEEYLPHYSPTHKSQIWKKYESVNF